MNSIAIQGIRGAFHEEAARYYCGSGCDVIPCMTFTEVTESVMNGKAETGIMAIENSISGTILDNLELIRINSLSITAEINLRIVQNLGGLMGSSLQGLREVHSHYMALNQCREFFRKYPSVRLVESADTALSIRDVAEWNNPAVAAIGSRLAIEQYGLAVLAEGIETHPHNYTRFAVIQKEPDPCPDNDKVSMSFTLPHKTGSLSRVLSLLNIMDINLTKLESVPVVGKPWNYRFYTDFILPDPNLFQSIFNLLSEITEELSLMGRYKTIKTENL